MEGKKKSENIENILTYIKTNTLHLHFTLTYLKTKLC